MPTEGLQLAAKSVASMFVRIIASRRPEIWDIVGPRFAIAPRDPTDLAGGFGSPGQSVMLNPQPLPPRELYALALADAHISDLLNFDRVGTLFGGEAGERATERSLRVVSEIEELCPRWPRWPQGWPPPPPPWHLDEEMTATELFVLGLRFLAATEVIEQGKVQEALTSLGEKALNLSLQY